MKQSLCTWNYQKATVSAVEFSTRDIMLALQKFPYFV